MNLYTHTFIHVCIHTYIHTYIQWEEGPNRDIILTEGSLRESLHIDDGQFGIQSKPVYTVSVLVRVRVEKV